MDQQPASIPALAYASPPSPPRKRWGWLVWTLSGIFVALLFMCLLNFGVKSTRLVPAISLSDFENYLASGAVQAVVIRDGELEGTFSNPPSNFPSSQFRVDLTSELTSNWQFVSWILATRNQATVRIERGSGSLLDVFLPLVPWLLIFGFIWFGVFRHLRTNKNRGSASEPVYMVLVNPESKSQ